MNNRNNGKRPSSTRKTQIRSVRENVSGGGGGKNKKKIKMINEVSEEQHQHMSESMIAAIQNKAREETEREHEKIRKKVKKDKPETEKNIVPLDHSLLSLYDESVVPGSKIDDKKYYRDGVFHEDEQKEKTEEIKERQRPQLFGLDDPDDPGFFPPIEYNSPDMKMPEHALVSDYSGKEYFVFPLTWDQIGTDWTIIVLGKRRSGKSKWIQSLCGNYFRPFFPRVVVFTKTKCSGEYSKFVPEAHIHEGLDEEILNKYFTMQKKYKELHKKGEFHGNMRLLIILDDCLSDQIKYKKTIDEVFFEGRHIDICFIASSQDFKGINPACTSNADLAVVFNFRSERDKEAVRTKFCDFFKNDDDMESLTNLVTHKKWHIVAFDQSEPSRDPRFTIFCGRAPEPPPFVMGCSAWWKHSVFQLLTIVNEHPEELGWLLKTPDWGVIGECEFNAVL